MADRGHAFAELKRGYTRAAVIVQEREMRAMDGVIHGLWLRLRRARPSVAKLDCGRQAEAIRRSRKARRLLRFRQIFAHALRPTA